MAAADPGQDGSEGGKEVVDGVHDDDVVVDRDETGDENLTISKT